MNRDEHVAWARDRALKYLDQGSATMALASILADLGRFPGLMRHPDMPKIRKALIRRDPGEVRKVLEGLK